MVPKLEFDYQQYKRSGDDETFSEYVSRVLLSSKTPVLECLHLRLSLDNCAPMDIASWIGIAYARHVHELELDVIGPSSNIKLPIGLYYYETLDTLKLKNSVLIDIPCQDCYLKALRTLHLCYVDYENDASVVNFLSGRPKLENLVVNRRRWDYVKTFNIAVPSLQRLEICDWNWNGQEKEEELGDYAINVPSLKYLKIKGTRDIRFRLVEIAPEANVSDLQRSFISIKSLSSSLSEIAFPNYTIFHELVYLELCTSQAMWCNLLTLMINTSPKLQVLKLIGCGWGYRKVRAGRWNQPKNVPECLETFVWNSCKEEQQEEEKKVVKYILGNANRLKKANISIKGFNSHERLKMLEELESVVKASKSSCNSLLVAE
ncbi:hypothetical protein Bca101_021137 [Brassica carinata]